MRHAETVDNAARIWQGHKDSELSETGRAQMLAAAPHLAAYRPALLVSSDLQRAAATAGAIPELTGLEVRLDGRLGRCTSVSGRRLHADEVRARCPEAIAALDRGEDVPPRRHR